ncbi:farnesyltranstransferase [Marinicauda salina]|uniref:Octaprenyl diphosphate synthase n=2 Tax=Marinicauda salina TaxID=2135793 RepID=A0A2U2BUD6_9PROT|nr:farnesyltranstransferase [Marinicauda salina]
MSRLVELGGEDMAAVDALLAERVSSAVPVIPKLARYLVDAGGKRIRPLITVATARMLGYRGEGHVSLAAAVEFIHTATLLHDDVVDESELRRGKAPANQVWGNSHSVLVGDFLFARAFTLMVDAGSMPALHVLSRAAAVIAEGEVRQLAAAGDISTSRDAYMEIIGAKTAALFAAAAQVSPILAGRPKAEEEALEAYGRELGLAFQLIDDALDYGGLSAHLGKNTGDDFREGKPTLPVVLAVAKADETERAFWSRVMRDKDQGDGDFDHAVSLINGHGALEATLAAARGHADAARRALAVFPRNPWSEALDALAEFVVERAY